MELTSKQRAQLRGLANTIDTGQEIRSLLQEMRSREKQKSGKWDMRQALLALLLQLRNAGLTRRPGPIPLISCL